MRSPPTEDCARRVPHERHPGAAAAPGRGPPRQAGGGHARPHRRRHPPPPRARHRGPQALAQRALVALRRGVRAARPPRLPGRPGALPEGAAARQPPRRLAARRRPPGLGPRLPPPPAPRRLRHRHRRAEPAPALRPGRPQQRLLRRPDPRGERVAARSLAPARAAAARQRGGALRGRRRPPPPRSGSAPATPISARC